MFSNIVSDFKGYKRPLLAQGFWATLFHRYGSWARGFRFKLIRVPLAVIHIFLIKFSEIFFGIYIGANAKIGPGFVIEHFGGVIIHSSTTIGKNVRVRQGVTIGNKKADSPEDVPVIGDYVDIGAGAKVLGGIHLGEGCFVGANAVVVTDVPAHSIAVGVPATIKRSKVHIASSNDGPKTAV